MKSVRFLLPILLPVALLLSNCGSDASSQPTPGTDAIPAPPPPSAKPETYLYVATVDNLLLRDQPTQKGSKVVAKFKEGDFVEGTGEVSANKEEATIRTIPMIEPYFKVISTTPEQFTGWAFGGALQRVYAGPRSASPDLGRLSQFSMFLKTLNIKKIESGKKAWDYVQTNLGTVSGTTADAVFILLENFLRRMQFEGTFYTMTEKIKWADEDYAAISEGKFEVNKYPATKMLADNGFDLATAEGTVFPVVDWTKLQAFFANKATPSMKAYINQNVVEQDNEGFEDGGIVIPLEEIADRAIFWEKFNQSHPYFLLIEETRESQHWMRMILTNGANNTPVFNFESESANEDFKKMWAYVLTKYPGTQVYKAVKEFSDLVAAEGGKSSKKVEALQTKNAE